MTVTELLEAATRVLGVRLTARRETGVVDDELPAPLGDAPLEVLAGKILYSHNRNKHSGRRPRPWGMSTGSRPNC